MKKTLLLILTSIFLFSFILNCATNRYIKYAPEDSPKINNYYEDPNPIYESIIRLNMSNGGFCTGFVIDRNYALTAAHCVQNSLGAMENLDIDIYDSFGMPTSVVAKPLAMDAFRDVAIIKGKFDKFKIQKVDFSGSHFSNNVRMLSCGYPSNMFKKFCVELIQYGNKYFKYRTKGPPIQKGMSGGPVINYYTGYAIGVNSEVDYDSVIIGPVVGFPETVGL